VDDLAHLTAAMMPRREAFDLSGGFGGMRVAFTDPKIWRLGDEICTYTAEMVEHMVHEYLPDYHLEIAKVDEA